MKKVGYIGLGIMGGPMAQNLLKAGFEVFVWNRTREKAAAVLEHGAQWADSPAEVAARAEAVCINVTDTPDVEQVIFSKHGIVAGNPGDTAGLIVIDNSTISPQATRDFAGRLADYEIEYLDAPVSGGDVGARKGTLAVMVGGKAEVFERAMPIFHAVGKAITHVGPVGAGQACKACNQVFCAVHMVALCEALALASKEGLDLHKMIEVVGAGAGGSWALSNLGPRIANNDMAPGFMIDLINKDLNIVYREAANLNIPMPGTRLASEFFRAAAALGHGSDGTQAMARLFEKMAAFSYHPNA